jgi:hypothetical protein
MRTATATAAFVLASLIAFVASSAVAQQEDAESLAKKAQNPIANLISVPIQTNTNFNVGPLNGSQEVINIQPVIPIKLSDDWNVITRWITPLIYQPQFGPGQGDAFGLGDIQPSFFFSPAGGDLIWGVGPTVVVPTATNRVLGQGKLSLGPAGVIVYTPGHWVPGALANNVWSIAGDGHRANVNQGLLQPFVNYNLEGGWYLTSSPIITADWNAPSSNRWTVPIGGGGGRLMRIGGLPINITLQGYGNVVSPANGPDWTIRFQVQALFPK